MKQFATLVRDLDQTNRTKRKVDLLAAYFKSAPPQDRIWTIALFTGRRPKRQVGPAALRKWGAEQSKLPDWLFEECYAEVGDLAETVSLLLPPAVTFRDLSLSAMLAEIRALENRHEEEKKAYVQARWKDLPTNERFVFNKLLTGGFRLGVAQNLICRALAQSTGFPRDQWTQRLMGQWDPALLRWDDLVATIPTLTPSTPYPFCLAHPYPDPLPERPPGPLEEWLGEWKWDGIRSQLIKREGEIFLWSRGEDLINPSFPEITEAAETLPEGTVLDGEILAWSNSSNRPLPFQNLQKRLNRKKPGPSLRSRIPVVFMAYDLLESKGTDQRPKSLVERRRILEKILSLEASNSPLRISPLAPAKYWSDLAQMRHQSRDRGTEGLILKKKSSPYAVGRKRGVWWKWKIDPLSLDAVLVYAQRGHGRRSGLYTDYTFALWDGNELVPFAKAYSGLANSEIREVDRFIRQNTREKFGPVRTVTPELVFEVGFEGIVPSKRHKSGFAVRFPRILRWRQDKKAAGADHLESLRELLRATSPIP